MADLALNNSLIDEYIKYKFDDGYNTDTIRNLLKHISTFNIRDSYFNGEPALKGWDTDPLIEIIDDCNDDILVKESILKLMLIDKYKATSYTNIDINDKYKKLSLHYGATYPSNTNKSKASTHIQALLSDAKWVRIIDRYISDIRESKTQWLENKKTIKDIVPCRQLDLTIVSQNINKIKYKTDLKPLCKHWNVKAQNIQDNTHDRYIETNKLTILLSSGLYNLHSGSTKDFTYVIKLK